MHAFCLFITINLCQDNENFMCVRKVNPMWQRVSLNVYSRVTWHSHTRYSLVTRKSPTRNSRVTRTFVTLLLRLDRARGLFQPLPKRTFPDIKLSN